MTIWHDISLIRSDAARRGGISDRRSPGLLVLVRLVRRVFHTLLRSYVFVANLTHRACLRRDAKFAVKLNGWNWTEILYRQKTTNRVYLITRNASHCPHWFWYLSIIHLIVTSQLLIWPYIIKTQSYWPYIRPIIFAFLDLRRVYLISNLTQMSIL